MTHRGSVNSRKYRAAVRAELQQLRAERGPYWRPRWAPRMSGHRPAPGEAERAAALAEIDAAWYDERTA